MRRKRNGVREIKNSILLFITLSLSFMLHSSFSILYSSQSAPTEAEEYALKAAFLYNFTKYIEWPSAEANEKEFIIGVVGSSPIVNPLIEIAKNKTVKGKKIIIHQFS